ncbi:MAG: thiopurine S-methyltransferase [Gammaproteobacteria bacterium]|jgi:thiopurine S-methyltransferase|nr:thiopurine S-methyltransferase [Gammaproteobacteria bacterium]MBT3489132.1 thiopurine S-methyltransferase [Gammaproteobacteria bacterium]MBT3719574.1 thiopurine S-methyltransferase [Gammaproteobacteria bacterium]MBT3844404.1 thiopurine S-methyltransferase [Gammaproteobacteria bacterium]MBT3893510.1 thiopurine S-methyltransferase [Gammaproteobacteria bacterium]
MEADHWHQRWQEGRIGFHQGKPNIWLLKFYSELELTPGEPLLLPLCGKSVDLVWLAEQGHPVIGVELSDIAIRDFFKEQQLSASEHSQTHFKQWQSGPLTLLEGDFFDLSHQDLGNCRVLFDRAALVALPAEMRQRYAAHTARLLTAGSRILLVTTDYPQHEKSPPPFAVSDEEVRTLYGEHFTIELLHSENLSNGQDPLSKRGVTSLVERIYKLTKRG